jgi:hypothetical protein
MRSGVGRGEATDAILYAFDLLEFSGEESAASPARKRKENLGPAKGMRSPVFRFWHTICFAPAT